MITCINTCTACRASFVKIRNVVGRAQGTTVFITSLFAVCLIVPIIFEASTMNTNCTTILTLNDVLNQSSESTERSLANDSVFIPANVTQTESFEFNDENPEDVLHKEAVQQVLAKSSERGRRKYQMLGRNDMLNASRTCRRTLPDAIIIGVMKAGTEAFSTFLAINPQVAMSLSVRSTLFFNSQYHKGLSWYRNQMECSNGNQKTVEKAPQYFHAPVVPRRIFKMNKRIKLILLVRNPIDRAISHYLQVKSSHPQHIRGSFEDMVFARNGAVNSRSNFIFSSKYSITLRRWLQYFHFSQILILDGDKFKKDQIKVLSQAETFLGIKHFITDDKFVYNKEKEFYCLKAGGNPVCLGSGKGREHPTLRIKDYQKLRSYFKPFNEQFFRMARRRFDW